MKHEIKKRHNLPNREIADPAEFTDICLGEVDYNEMGEIPRYVVTGGMYVVPQERPNGEQTGLARVCVSRPVDLSDDEVADILEEAGLFDGMSIWVVDGKDVDSEWNERIYSVLSLDAGEETDGDEGELTYW